jgi:hypothetical protein
MKPIKIETEKVWDAQQGACRKIISVDAAKREELPKEYTTGKCCYLDRGSLRLVGAYPNIDPLRSIDEAEFQRLMKYVHECGQRLRDINAANKAAKEAWTGQETFWV